MFTTTKKNLIAHLVNELGISSDDFVFMHSGIVGLGKLENGFDTITEAFDEVLKNGLLVIPSFTYSWCKGEVYDPLTTECPNEVGSYSQNAWKDKRFVRSSDPNFAIAALKNGRNQALIESIFDIRDSCFGKNSVYDHLYQLCDGRNGYILLLGGAHSDFVFRCTFIHYVEEKVGVPSRYLKNFYNPQDSREYIQQLCRFHSIQEYKAVTGIKNTEYSFPIVSDYTALGKDLIKSGFFIKKSFGYSESRMVPIRTFCDFLEEKLIAQPDYCVKGINHGYDSENQQMFELR